MRDYNSIQFRNSRKGLDSSGNHTPEEEKKQSDGVDTSMNSKMSFSGSASTVTTSSTSPTPRNPQLAAVDALAIRRDGAEATISRLRNALEETSARDSNAKTALAKSDAVIFELRSSVRQLKRQVEKLQEEKLISEDNQRLSQKEVEEMKKRLGRATPDMSAEARDGRVGELQVQLDRAHAQILTADMVRKELEDTLEAEQYTWELRVQDQERTIQQLQQECATLADDLEQCRSQWKEAEEGWTQEVQELQSKLDTVQQEALHWKSVHKDKNDTGGELKTRVLTLERERKELQSCLDEALKELEAVDAELQGEPSRKLRDENDHLRKTLQENHSDFLEPLQHLYRFLLERDGVEDSIHSSPKNAREALAAIQSHLQRLPSNDKDVVALQKQVKELESQLSVYRGDLQAREESSSELRSSLKEAVALLKPLQDAVAKADREKLRLTEKLEKMQQQGNSDSAALREQVKKLRQALEDKEQEIDKLQQEIESLELQLSRAKLAVASNVVKEYKVTDVSDSLTQKREELKAKRAAEQNLRSMLNDARTRYGGLNQQGNATDSTSRDIQEVGITDSVGELHEAKRALTARDARIAELENETKALRGDLSKKEVELRSLEHDLEEAVSVRRQLDTNSDADAVRQTEGKVRALEIRLSSVTNELKAKKEVETRLNKSLKEALGLLRPLQMHLEEAETEKAEMALELQKLRREKSGESIDVRNSDSGKDQEKVIHLEAAVRHLEDENNRLQMALEDVSHSINASHVSQATGVSQKSEAKLKEDIVELKSRYEVTQGRLEDAIAENRSLVESLKTTEREEKDMAEEIKVLREKLKLSRAELENAKFIATTALVKVEDMTMSQVGQTPLNNNEQQLLYREKAREFDREMRAVRQQKGKVPYRLT